MSGPRPSIGHGRDSYAPARARAILVVTFATALVLGCGPPGSSTDPTSPGGGLLAEGESICAIPSELLASGGVVADGIPALNTPDTVASDATGAAYLRDSDRVLGVLVNGDARAYPHNILWYHEIVNDVFFDGARVTISFCPLTGSGLAWESEVDGKVVDFGVSGLLFANNLVMYDRGTGQLYGPQMSVSGKCGGFLDASPALVPVQEMSWARWKELYPWTTVVSSQTIHELPYRTYPYGTYDRITNEEFLWEMTVDRTRPIKERVLGIPRAAGGGIAYPFVELSALGSTVAVNDELPETGPYVVFFEGAHGQNALTYRASIDEQPLTFEVREGRFVDIETESAWDLAGVAVDGPLSGRRLLPLKEAYVSFWFAWRHFQPAAEIFTARP